MPNVRTAIFISYGKQGGVTFVTNENAGYRDGITLGNYININLNGKITGNFADFVINDPLYMHEYGHTIDSRIFGPSYLFAVGVPSIFSANNNTAIDIPPFDTHGSYWTEVRANQNAKRYFSRYYGVDWNRPHVPYWWLPDTTLEDYYPTR